MEFLDVYMLAMTSMAVGFWAWVGYKLIKKFIAWRALKLSRKLTELYWDALNVYINSGSSEGAICYVLLLKIFGHDHRRSALEATVGYISALLDGDKFELNRNQQQRAQEVLKEIKAISTERTLSLAELAIAKASAFKSHPNLITAINSFESSYFKKRYPSYFS